MKLLFIIFSIYMLIWFPAIASFAQEPLNWTRDEINPGEDFTLIPDESFFTEGIKSCHMQLNSGAVPYLYSDVFYINPGEEYAFSIDIFDNDTAGQVKVYADFYDMYGFNIFGHAPVFSEDSMAWQTISWNGVVPDQAAVGYVLLKYYCQPDLYHFTTKANIWIDNITFRNAAGDNLLVNGGFEEWNVSLDEIRGEEDIICVYPNPASDFVTVELKAADAEFVFICDLSGREILKYDAVAKKLIRADVRVLQKGIYIISVFNKNKTLSASKLLIN